MSISAATRVVALLGHPVGHSASPAVQNAAFAAAGVDAIYVAFDVSSGSEAVAAVSALGLLGANVTVPHKQVAFDVVQHRTDVAAASGAVNTLFWSEGRLTGDNTDVEGLSHVFAADVGLAAGDGVVLFGAGGAARAAAVALGRSAAVVDVVARRPDAAEAVRELARSSGAKVGDVPDPRVVINATPLGLRGEALPDRFMTLAPGQVALDLVYGPRPTPFVAAARERGAAGFDGRGMLLGQAAAAFERWTSRPAPRAVMAAAAESALSARG